MSRLIEMVELPFMQNALVAGLLIGALSSYYGVFVVQRKMSYLGSGLSHAAFGGVALGLFLNWDPFGTAAIFCLLIATLITHVKIHSKIDTDTIIGFFFSFSMALGLLLLSIHQDRTANAMNYLFGSLLSVSGLELTLTAAFAVLTLCLLPLWGRWAFATFDVELASAEHLPIGRDNYLLNLLVALNTVIAMKMVGILLISAFLVIPPATARLLSRSLASMTLLSIFFGCATTVIGILMSYFADLPSGATIVMLQSLLFIFFYLLSLRRS